MTQVEIVELAEEFAKNLAGGNKPHGGPRGGISNDTLFLATILSAKLEEIRAEIERQGD